MVRIITMEEIAEVRAEERARELAEDFAKELAEERAKDLAKDLARELAEDLAKDQVKEMYGKYIIFCKRNGDSVEDILQKLKVIYALDDDTAETYIHAFYCNE